MWLLGGGQNEGADLCSKGEHGGWVISSMVLKGPHEVEEALFGELFESLVTIVMSSSARTVCI